MTERSEKIRKKKVGHKQNQRRLARPTQARFAIIKRCLEVAVCPRAEVVELADTPS
jgi:hypothetical protein